MLMLMLMLHAAAATVAAAGEGGGEEEDKRAWRRMTKYTGVRRWANAYMVLEGCPDRVPASRGHTYGSHGPY